MRGVIVPAGNYLGKAGGGGGYGKLKDCGVVREFEDVGGRDRSDEVRGLRCENCFCFTEDE